jgi:hypothetical protein
MGFEVAEGGLLVTKCSFSPINGDLDAQAARCLLFCIAISRCHAWHLMHSEP